MSKLLLLVFVFATLMSPAHAALDGWDNKPGDPCTPAEEGHTRRNASADLDSSEITLICDGAQWQSAAGGGLSVLQGQDDTGPCTEEKNGLIRYRDSADPHWEYCHGGTTSWLPFKLPQCQNDDAGECTLAALRSSSDPQFTAANIRCGSKLLGVTGTYGSGASNAFTFTDVTNAALSTLATASAVTISGIPAGCPGEVFVSGQGSPQISINGGTWGTTGTIANGQTLAVRLTSSASFSTAHTATISIGSTDEEWSVTTLAADTIPNAFDFTDQADVALSTLTTSNIVTISGINTTTPVSVSGTGADISINGGGWVTSGTIQNGQTLQVRLTSSATPGAEILATITVGGVGDEWRVTTLGPDTTPNAFDFTPNLTDQALNEAVYSNTIVISGINTSAPVSVSGGGSPEVSISGGSWVASGTITNGQTLRVRLTTANAYVTARTATVNVGGVADAWSATTMANVVPGSQTFTTAGSHTFTVPAYNNLIVQVWGGGGGGAGCSSTSEVVGASGEVSSWDNTVTANGGTRASTSAGGAGGTATGGATNTTGQNGSTASNRGAKGGDGANGGVGGAQISSAGNGKAGSAPGGGGGGALWVAIMASGMCHGDGGGGGSYSSATYSAGTYPVGISVPVTVGAGGNGGNGSNYDGGKGAVGRVTITWD